MEESSRFGNHEVVVLSAMFPRLVRHSAIVLEIRMVLDVVIPVGPNDADFLDKCIASVRKYCLGIRTIYCIPWKPLDVSGAVCVSECSFPFSKTSLQEKIPEKRSSWYLQQLLKLYAPLVIPSIAENVLIVDADTLFFKPVRFMDGSVFLMDKNNETHPSYFEHMRNLHPSFLPWKPHTSGIVNVMVYNRDILKELFTKVEGSSSKPFWQAFLDAIPPADVSGSGASEYELYFHYILRNHPGRVRLRPLRYYNFGQRKNLAGGDFHYINYHHHIQKR